MSDFTDSIDGKDLNLENLRRQLSYTFLDAYGNFDGANILFDLIVKATEERIIKLLNELDDEEWMGINQNFIALIKGEQK